jgi:hypothetical protein
MERDARGRGCGLAGVLAVIASCKGMGIGEEIAAILVAQIGGCGVGERKVWDRRIWEGGEARLRCRRM